MNLEKQKSFKFLSHDEIIGISLLTISFLLYIVSSYTFSPLAYHLLILPLFISACIMLLFNWQTLRELIFPIVMLCFLIPLPSEIIYSIGSTLSATNSNLSYILLKSIGTPVSLASNYGTPSILLTLQETEQSPNLL